jgi:hypothetical protein
VRRLVTFHDLRERDLKSAATTRQMMVTKPPTMKLRMSAIPWKMRPLRRALSPMPDDGVADDANVRRRKLATADDAPSKPPKISGEKQGGHRNRGGQAVGDLHGVLSGFANGQRAPFKALPQCLTFEQLRDDVRRAVMLPDVVNSVNVRVIQRGSGAGFVLKNASGAQDRRPGQWATL